MKPAETRLLIDAYLARVTKTTDTLGVHYGVPGNELLVAKNRGDIPPTGHLCGLHFRFHGTGLYVRTAKTSVDFDWGPSNELGGFDAWRLAQFSRTNKPFCRRSPPGYSEKQIEEALQHLDSGAQIAKRGSHLYFLVAGPI